MWLLPLGPPPESVNSGFGQLQEKLFDYFHSPDHDVESWSLPPLLLRGVIPPPNVFFTGMRKTVPQVRGEQLLDHK